MDSDHSDAPAARLDVARRDRDAAADTLRAARGPVGSFHAAVHLRATEDEVEAREAWLAWTDRAD